MMDANFLWWTGYMRGRPRLQNELIKREECEIFDEVIATGRSGDYVSEFGDDLMATLIEPLRIEPLSVSGGVVEDESDDDDADKGDGDGDGDGDGNGDGDGG